MPGATADLGTGVTITFGTSGFAGVLRGIPGWSGISRGHGETTPLGVSAGNVSNRTFIPGRAVDPGQLECEFFHNPSLTPPINGATETITVTAHLVEGDSTPATWSASGFMTSYDISGIEIDNVMVARSVIKLSGDINVTAAT